MVRLLSHLQMETTLEQCLTVTVFVHRSVRRPGAEGQRTVRGDDHRQQRGEAPRRVGLGERRAQIGRAPVGDGTVAAIRSLRAQGVSMDKIARQLKVGKGVSQRVCQQFDRERAEVVQ